MKEFNISGIVNVSLYQSIIEPEVALGECSEYPKNEFDSYDDAVWDRFDADMYREKVKELAVVELKALLATLPEAWRCEYVEGSAEIHYAYEHNILDRLYFKVTHSGKSVHGWDISEKTLQDYLTSFFLKDWEAEFGAQYRIYAHLGDNHTIGDFLRNAPEVSA